jgi:hypothetical protein
VSKVGIGVSLFLFAIGAILLWAVEVDVAGLDINVIGIILMIVGAIGFVASMLFWAPWAPYRRDRRDTHVDEPHVH